MPPMTVAEALAKIHKRSWVLPAIQREFVWGTDQICSLFDSLMRGYPLGSFLLWSLEKDQVGNFTFYDFLVNYHERTQPYAHVAQISENNDVIAVLDGQQRLTALNIGLYGSHAERLPRKWADNPDAYPKKRLYLNLLHTHGDEELGLAYDLQFLTGDEAATVTDDGAWPWFKVADVLKLDNAGPAIMAKLTQRHIDGAAQQPAFETLYALYNGIRTQQVINAFQEESQNPDRVLDIFVRVNSGGTKLSNSDLLLSMATNQWKDLDAREEIRSLVSELADGSGQFKFSKDLVLKTGLMLTEAPDFRFKISNFTQGNMHRLEQGWKEIRASLLRAATLLASFGLSGRNLTADSVVIPVAYYLHAHGLGDSYLTASAHAADRKVVRTWVFRSLLKRGIWGSGLDTLLRHIQTVIREAPTGEGFPREAMESTMASRGKSLTFSAEEIDELLEQQYSKPRTFPVLAMLYPGLDLSQVIHEDHLFPRSRFTPSALAKAGIPSDQIDEYTGRVNGLANLQLLAGVPNVEKGTAWPWVWLTSEHFTSAAARDQYIAQNDLDLLPADLTGFISFYEERKKRLAQRLSALLDNEI